MTDDDDSWGIWLPNASSSFIEVSPQEPQSAESQVGAPMTRGGHKKKRKGKGRAADVMPDPLQPNQEEPALEDWDHQPCFPASGQSGPVHIEEQPVCDPVTSEKSAQERAMENQDILGEIFNVISFDLDTPGNDPSQTRKDLFYAACTCRAFLDPAVNALWRVLPSLYPLLKLLPSFQLVNSQYILPDVNPEEWGLLEDYARRVRIIEYTSLRWSVSPLVYFRLNQLRRSSLFPALKMLRFPPNVSVDMFSPFSMLSPDMERLELNHSLLSDSELFRPFFAFATTNSPNITHLVLRGDVAIDLKPIFLFGSLHTLELELSEQLYDTEFFRRLGQLTTLRNLTLFLGPSNPRPESPVPLNGFLPSTRFGSSLETLRIKGSTAAITQLSRPRVTGRVLAQVLRTAGKFRSVRQAYHHFHLIGLFVIVCAYHRLQNLEVLEIQNGRFTLSETDFLALLSAFPRLRRLSLPNACQSSFPPISVLWEPSSMPSTLEELRFCCFNAGTSGQLPANLKDVAINRSVAHHKLRRLAISSEFHHISDHDVILLARLLDTAYPNLDVVEGYGPNAANGYESWSRVNLFRAALRDNRLEMEITSNP
ncbi:hypothetical protein M413DRAFT_24845 [Hebeloma cylindrosporum]|uniref:F-box domain-containing protein n=1 Tax=Hebeloma cylindrosporum TaxID=76867 RepID=A0A0C2Y793_HEBCY|nr:hypothetical protein M413DRAFT_24845 [Hebeloma cylindrosporum h7]